MPLLLHPFNPRGVFFHPGVFWGFGIFVVLAQLALFVGLILLLVALLRRDRRPGALPQRPPALGILEERYATGQISREEFLERRSVLTGTPAPSGGAGPGDPTEPVPRPGS